MAVVVGKCIKCTFPFKDFCDPVARGLLLRRPLWMRVKRVATRNVDSSKDSDAQMRLVPRGDILSHAAHVPRVAC